MTLKVIIARRRHRLAAGASTPPTDSTLAWAATAWGNGVWGAGTWAGMVDDGGGFGLLRMAPEGAPEYPESSGALAVRRPWYVRMWERLRTWTRRVFRRRAGR